MSTITIGLVSGDPAGVGPELCAKILAKNNEGSGLRIALFSGSESIRNGLRIARIENLDLPVCKTIVEMPKNAANAVIECADNGGYQMGIASAQGGAATLAALESAADAAVAKRIDAIVYAPLNKQAMWLAGHKAIDELHFFQNKLGHSGFCCELNKQGDLWTTRVTSHIPLRQVADKVTIDAIVSATETGAQAFRSAERRQPRIAIAGLNPHLGEGGAMGSEEIEVIQPAMEVLRARGYDVAGLYSADTIFLRAEKERYDLVVTMFHDQGQIALKALGFASTSTILGGLPLPIVTASQGTAYDIVGQNRADPAGLSHAVELAFKLAVSHHRSS